MIPNMDALISRQNFKISKSQRTRMKPVDVCKVRCSFSLPRNHVPRLFFSRTLSSVPMGLQQRVVDRSRSVLATEGMNVFPVTVVQSM